MDRSLQKRQLILYFCFAYAIAWLFFLPLGLSLAGLGWIPLHLSLPIMTVLGTTAPTLSALLTLRITEHRWPKKRRIANASAREACQAPKSFKSHETKEIETANEFHPTR
jgi:hypothetical protein